jgi:DNA-directed RNA polymerase subunit M/transcription elongation factor TFIIS
VVRDLSKEVQELDDDDPVDPAEEVVIIGEDGEERCERCGAPDSIVYFSQQIPGANTSLNMIGQCERCGFKVPGPKREPELRELPDSMPRDDFGRRRRSW